MTTPSTSSGQAPSPKLALYLNDRGDLLRQIFRSANIAVYARSSGRASAPHQYELVVIQTRANGVEAFPSLKEWNRFGWSFPVYEADFACRLAEEMGTFPGPYRAWIRRQMIGHVQRKLDQEPVFAANRRSKSDGATELYASVRSRLRQSSDRIIRFLAFKRP